MIDTAALTAAVETLQEYCEQVRHVMVARGYPEAHVSVDTSDRRLTVWVHDSAGPDQKCVSFAGHDAFVAALSHVEYLPPLPTPDDFAATIGIAPDGRVVEQVEG